jgi:hypothetical protein
MLAIIVEVGWIFQHELKVKWIGDTKFKSDELKMEDKINKYINKNISNYLYILTNIPFKCDI